METESSGELVN